MQRRDFLRGALITAALIPVAGSLASCAAGEAEPVSAGVKSATNPFGLKQSSTVDAVIFNGGNGYDYVTYAAELVEDNHKGVTTKITPVTNIAQTMQPRFVAGNPPDLLDNSGSNQIGYTIISDQLSELDDVFAANNLEGEKISDTLYPGVKTHGTPGDELRRISYTLTAFGVWYSASLFEQNGWAPPKTWDEAFDLGAKAEAAGKYLWVWGKEASTYYLTLVANSAIKEGGDEVRLAMDNLKPKAWSMPEIRDTLTALEKMVKLGYFIPGGAGTQFTAAQARWSNDQQALLYPSGAWIANEMKKVTKEGFRMTVAPEPTLSANPKLPYEAMRAAYDGQFMVPKQAKNVAGGKEVLRTMLSKDAATNFTRTRLASTIVKGLVPEDGFGSTALVSQTKMLAAAGTNTFDYLFPAVYGMGADHTVLWSSFLSGSIDAAGLAAGMQQISDEVANDSSVKKIPVT